MPIVEHTELFKRAIGEYTDVVEKEMYTFTDQGGDSLTLRPEATAGMVRAAISNGLLRGARLKLWCQGPMFRHEKPQKGRFRQFNQVDVEAIGFAGPDVDIELIALVARLWKLLGITRVKLQINSLGTPESRKALSRAAARVFPRAISTSWMPTACGGSRATRCAFSTASIRRPRPSSPMRRCSPSTWTPNRRRISRN